jgi:hypothetical protein
MATDVTTLLIQMMTASGQANGLAANRALLGGAADLLSTTADYAQILGTAAPAAQALAAALVTSVAADVTVKGSTAAVEAAALSTAIANPAVGAAVVLIVSFVIVYLSAIGQSDQSQQVKDLAKALTADLTDLQLADYWQGKMTGTLSDLWSPVGTDLDNLAHEGTGGTNVTHDVSHFHDHALAFVRHLVNDFGSELYWQVPAQPAGDVPQSDGPMPGQFWPCFSWYGQFPTRLTVAGSPSGNVVDPRTMAPVLALGIQSYLTLESLLNVIDQTQPTLQRFVNDFRTDLAGQPNSYLDFLYGMYELAVCGIVKTDLPSEEEILGALWHITQVAGVSARPSTNPASWTSWGAPWDEFTYHNFEFFKSFSGNGLAWNLRYGVSETYPQYGFYGKVQLDQARTTLFTPAYIVSAIDFTNAVSQWQQALVLFNVWDDTYVSMDSLQNWVIPWLENRLILGRMARWKAIYLLNGFDRLWSLLQALQRLAAPNTQVVPATMRLKQDDMIASGNWSARELCKVVVARGSMLTGNGYASADNEFVIIDWLPGSTQSVSGHSVAGFVQFLYNVANGNWAGPPEQDPQRAPPRPLSFRGLLASAAI